MTRLWLILLLMLGAGPGAAAEFVQPPGGDWTALQAELKEGRIGAGDTVVLQPGSHRVLLLSGLHFDPPLTFHGEPGAHADAIRVENASGLVVRGLSVWPTEQPDGQALVLTKLTARNIVLSDLDIRGRADAPQSYLRWSAEQWRTGYAQPAVRLLGPDTEISGATVTGTTFGITTQGPGARVIGNRISGFSGDAIRSLGRDSIVAGNTVENCVDIDDNHDDAFQAWSPRKSAEFLTGLRIESNRFFEWRAAPGHPLRCRLQGIGMFANRYRDIMIQNNLVSVSAFHGISVFGGQHVRIVNNTVVHADLSPGDSPWIMLRDGKSGGPGTWVRNNTVVNNLAARVVIDTTLEQYAPAALNAIVPYPMTAFRNAPAGDFRLRPGSPLASGGNPRLAPPVDIDGDIRPQGAGPDFGALETR